MSAHVLLTCDVCENPSGDYGWTSIAAARRDMREAGWRKLSVAAYRRLLGSDPGLHIGLDICDECYKRYGEGT